MVSVDVENLIFC